MKYRRAKFTGALLRYALVSALAFVAALAYAEVGMTEVIAAKLLSGPPGIDRTTVPAAHAAIVGFFRRHLLALK